MLPNTDIQPDDIGWFRCPNCDYALIGLDRPICPECGTDFWLAADRARFQTWPLWVLFAAGLVWLAGAGSGLWGDKVRLSAVLSLLNYSFLLWARWLLLFGFFGGSAARIYRPGWHWCGWVATIAYVLLQAPSPSFLRWLAIRGGVTALSPGLLESFCAMWTSLVMGAILAVACTALQPGPVPSQHRKRWHRADLRVLAAVLSGMAVMVGLRHRFGAELVIWELPLWTMLSLRAARLALHIREASRLIGTERSWEPTRLRASRDDDHGSIPRCIRCGNAVWSANGCCHSCGCPQLVADWLVLGCTQAFFQAPMWLLLIRRMSLVSCP